MKTKVVQYDESERVRSGSQLLSDVQTFLCFMRTSKVLKSVFTQPRFVHLPRKLMQLLLVVLTSSDKMK